MTYNPGKGPCKDCDKRHVGCHARCDDYLEWRNIRDEAKQKELLETCSVSLASRARHTQYLRKHGRKKI